MSDYNLSVTEFFLVLFTGLLVLVGATQIYWVRKTVRSMEDTAVRQLRAYVSLGATGKITNDFNPELPAFQIRIRNTGQTPAYNVKSWRGIGIHELPLVNDLNPIAGGAMDTDVVLGAGGDHMLPIRRERSFTPEELKGVEAGTHAIYVFGKVEYLDAFNKPRYTNFCLYEASGGSGAGLKHAAKGNSAN